MVERHVCGSMVCFSVAEDVSVSESVSEFVDAIECTVCLWLVFIVSHDEDRDCKLARNGNRRSCADIRLEIVD